MKPTLYFLRSSEQKIATDMLHYAARLDDARKTLQEVPKLAMYEKYYGLNGTDLGLYALGGHDIYGAAWIRLLREFDDAEAFIDEQTPVLNIAVKPQFRGQGVGSLMLEQLIAEAGALYESMSVAVVKESRAVSFFERFGFVTVEGVLRHSHVDDAVLIVMVKALPKEAVKRPSEGYDPTYWMD
jgi:ribosomal protein S18 acetylase RimI-like enzyme